MKFSRDERETEKKKHIPLEELEDKPKKTEEGEDKETILVAEEPVSLEESVEREPVEVRKENEVENPHHKPYVTPTADISEGISKSYQRDSSYESSHDREMEEIRRSHFEKKSEELLKSKYKASDDDAP